ncbi:arsenical PUMP membrane protein [Pelomyxa schiedti]|nr:arsenical PUMP membrane protein [Pelomyxa schiedti]
MRLGWSVVRCFWIVLAGVLIIGEGVEGATVEVRLCSSGNPCISVPGWAKYLTVSVWAPLPPSSNETTDFSDLYVSLDQFDPVEKMDWESIKVLTTITAGGDPASADIQLSDIDSFDKSRQHRISSYIEQLGSSEDAPTSMPLEPFVFEIELKSFESIGVSRVYFGLILLAITYLLLAFEVINRVLICIIADAVVIIFMALCGDTPSVISMAGFVDKDTLMILFGMMIIVGNFGKTGFFGFLAIKCYQMSKGHLWLLALIICTTTACVSTVLPNVTTILLMAPVSLSICNTVQVSPVPLLMASAMFSNIGGTATLIGDPPNILIGSMLGLTFADFVINMLPGIIICLATSTLYIQYVNHKIWMRPRKDVDIAYLLSVFRIHDWPLFIKVIITLGGALCLFLISSFLGISPGYIAMFGALLLVLLTTPQSAMGDHFREVEWETLLFYMALFSLIGCIEELGVIRWLGNIVSDLIDLSPEEWRLTMSVIVLIWFSGLVSSVIDNTIYARMMIPVIRIVAKNLDLPIGTLGWALSFGCCLGGNSTLIGSSANVIAAAIAKQAHFRMSFLQFSRIGAPLTVVTLATSTAYVVARYEPDVSVKGTIVGIVLGLGILTCAIVAIWEAFEWHRSKNNRAQETKRMIPMVSLKSKPTAATDSAVAGDICAAEKDKITEMDDEAGEFLSVETDEVLVLESVFDVQVVELPPNVNTN